jgi:hypothetical protein
MPLPTGWPPRVCSSRRSIRFYKTGAATANYADNAFLFADQAYANTFTPLPVVKAGDVTPPGSLPGTSPGVIDALPPVPSGSGMNGDDPHPMIWAQTIRVRVVGGPVNISFDGVNDHGFIPADTEQTYRMRFEAGIAIKGTGTFHIEAW